MADQFDITPVANTVFTGVGMGILAGTAMKTMNMVERSMYGNQRRYRNRGMVNRPRIHRNRIKMSNPYQRRYGNRRNPYRFRW